MARNVRVVTGGYAPQDRLEAMADAMTVRALRSRAPQQGGPVQVAMSPWEGVAQLGEAFIANRMNKRVNDLAKADQERALAANDAMIRQLAGEKAPRRLNEQGQPMGAPVQMPTDLENRPMMFSDRAEQLSAAMAGMDPRQGNQVLSAATLQRALGDPKEDEAYTLTPGAARFKGGQQIASMPTTPESQKLPAEVQEYEYYAKQATASGDRPLSFNEWRLQARRAGATSVSVNTGDDRYGKPQPGYYRPDPSQPGVTPQPGSKEYLEREQDASTREARAATAAEDAQNVKVAIKTAKGLINWSTTGFVGQVLGNLGGTGAYDLRAAIKPIQSSTAFDRLQRMREESKTGGALGQVAVKELELLMSTIATLDANQSDDQLVAALDLVDQRYDKAIRAYDSMLNEKGGGSTGDRVPSFATEAEAEAAGLQPGTRVIINGVPGVWQ